MSIFLDRETKVVVQGITGRDGRFHTQQMLDYNTVVVAGVSPGKGGEEVLGVPVFDTVIEAVEEAGANTSIIFVPKASAYDAVMEAISGGVKLIVCITEGMAIQDVIKLVDYAQYKEIVFIGPNCPGIISPGLSLVGIFPSQFFKKGSVGIVSRSGTLTYEVANLLSEAGLGQSTAIGVGGDPVVGCSFVDILRKFEKDVDTEAIVLIGEIGGVAEESAAYYIKEFVTKPVVAFISGKTAPPDKQMGHAGAIISSGAGTAQEKISALEAAGVSVALTPMDIPLMIRDLLDEC